MADLAKAVGRSGLLVLLAGSLASAGCFGSVPCRGQATWAEPGLSAWLAANGTAAGFEGGSPEALAAGPRVAAALPEDAVLALAWFFPDGDRTVRRGIQIAPAGVDVGAYRSADRRFTPPTAEEMLEALDAALDAVHRGDAPSREALRSQVRGSWPPQWHADAEFELHLQASGPWDFDAVFPEGGRFEFEEGVFNSFAGDGPWTLVASVTSWHYQWEGRHGESKHTLNVDGRDRAYLNGRNLGEGRQVKDLVQSTFPDRGWSFEGFVHETDCGAGPFA